MDFEQYPTKTDQISKQFGQRMGMAFKRGPQDLESGSGEWASLSSDTRHLAFKQDPLGLEWIWF